MMEEKRPSKSDSEMHVFKPYPPQSAKSRQSGKRHVAQMARRENLPSKATITWDLGVMGDQPFFTAAVRRKLQQIQQNQSKKRQANKIAGLKARPPHEVPGMPTTGYPGVMQDTCLHPERAVPSELNEAAALPALKAVSKGQMLHQGGQKAHKPAPPTCKPPTKTDVIRFRHGKFRSSTHPVCPTENKPPQRAEIEVGNEDTKRGGSNQQGQQHCPSIPAWRQTIVPMSLPVISGSGLGRCANSQCSISLQRALTPVMEEVRGKDDGVPVKSKEIPCLTGVPHAGKCVPGKQLTTLNLPRLPALSGQKVHKPSPPTCKPPPNSDVIRCRRAKLPLSTHPVCPTGNEPPERAKIEAGNEDTKRSPRVLLRRAESNPEYLDSMKERTDEMSERFPPMNGHVALRDKETQSLRPMMKPDPTVLKQQLAARRPLLARRAAKAPEVDAAPESEAKVPACPSKLPPLHPQHMSMVGTGFRVGQAQRQQGQQHCPIIPACRQPIVPVSLPVINGSGLGRCAAVKEEVKGKDTGKCVQGKELITLNLPRLPALRAVTKGQMLHQGGQKAHTPAPPTCKPPMNTDVIRRRAKIEAGNEDTKRSPHVLLRRAESHPEYLDSKKKQKEEMNEHSPPTSGHVSLRDKETQSLRPMMKPDPAVLKLHLAARRPLLARRAAKAAEVDAAPETVYPAGVPHAGKCIPGEQLITMNLPRLPALKGVTTIRIHRI